MFKELRTCLECQKEYNPIYKPQKFCSRKCGRVANGRLKTEKQTFTAQCSWCQKEFKRSISTKGKHNDFCSPHCSQAFIRGNDQKHIEKECPKCLKKFTCLYRKQPKFCSKSCAKSGENHHFFGKKIKGHSPWTKGLTAKTDPRLAALGKKISKVQKEQFRTGERSNVGANNPNYGKRADKRPLEQIERYSKAAVTRLQKNGSKFKGEFFSQKIQKTIRYRSSFEHRFLQCIDKDPDVVKFEYESVTVPYYDKKGKKHRYVPDFLVFYNNGTKKLIEIKSEYTSTVYHFNEKKKEAENWALINDSSFEVIMLKQIEDYENTIKVSASRLCALFVDNKEPIGYLTEEE